MPEFKHFPAVRCIEKRIQELNSEIEFSEKIMDNPELPSDYYYANIDVQNFKNEIKSLRNSLNFLINIKP